jgi:hypothetical protein
MRGHVVTNVLPLEESSGWVVPSYCRECGAPVLQECLSCGAEILSNFADHWFTGPKVIPLPPDHFCWNCGKPYPWATREQRIAHLYNLMDYEPNLDEADRLTIQEQIAVLSEPKASDEQLVEAGSRIKRLAPKMWEAALPVLQSVLSAEIRRQLGLP